MTLGARTTSGRISSDLGAEAGRLMYDASPSAINAEHRHSAGAAGDSIQIVGRDMSAIAEAGALMFKDTAVAMDAIFGDGPKTNSSFLSKVAAAGRRLVTGESLFMTLFTHQGLGKARVAFAAPYPGSILPFKLSSFGGALIAQSDAFLCATNGVTVGIHLQHKVMTRLFGREGFIMQRLEGEGWVFIHVGGSSWSAVSPTEKSCMWTWAVSPP